MSSNLQNKYNERLAEKLAVIVAKRGADSPAAQELKLVGGASAKNAKSAPEKKAETVKE